MGQVPRGAALHYLHYEEEIKGPPGLQAQEDGGVAVDTAGARHSGHTVAVVLVAVLGHSRGNLAQ